jgi:hypothetical protein
MRAAGRGIRGFDWAPGGVLRDEGRAGMMELVDMADLKSAAARAAWGFETLSRHYQIGYLPDFSPPPIAPANPICPSRRASEQLRGVYEVGDEGLEGVGVEGLGQHGVRPASPEVNLQVGAQVGRHDQDWQGRVGGLHLAAQL